MDPTHSATDHYITKGEKGKGREGGHVKIKIQGGPFVAYWNQKREEKQQEDNQTSDDCLLLCVTVQSHLIFLI